MLSVLRVRGLEDVDRIGLVPCSVHDGLHVFDVADTDDRAELLRLTRTFLRDHGERIANLGLEAWLDVAVGFKPGSVSTSVDLDRETIQLAANAGLTVTVSVYKTSDLTAI